MKKLIFFICLACFSVNISAQKITPEEYIALYKDFAIREMKRMGVPASITLAQGILETESGNSILVKKSNNHFGIKCKNTWGAEGVSHDDDEKGECFRAYKTAEGSYRDHSNFLRGNQRYGFLFKLDAADYKAWCYGLKKAGYATNPSYPQILINTIEKYNLNQYTLESINEVAKFDASLYEDDKNGQPALPSLSTPNSGTIQAVASISTAKPKTYCNGLKAVYAQKGTSLATMAIEYNIALATLLEFNDLKADSTLTDEQWVFLEKKNTQGNKEIYIVQENETLYDIAQSNAMQLQSLLEYNKLQATDIVKAGTKLRLKPEGNLSSINIEGRTIKNNTHVVQPKEGLYAISKRYNVTVRKIKEWNNLDTDELKIGQQVIVSQK
jgi:LysM repeat protein